MFKKTTITFSILDFGESGSTRPYKTKNETTVYYLFGFIPVYKASKSIKQID